MAVPIIFSLTFQTAINVRMLSIGGQGKKVKKRTGLQKITSNPSQNNNTVNQENVIKWLCAQGSLFYSFQVLKAQKEHFKARV